MLSGAEKAKGPGFLFPQRDYPRPRVYLGSRKYSAAPMGGQELSQAVLPRGEKAQNESARTNLTMVKELRQWMLGCGPKQFLKVHRFGFVSSPVRCKQPPSPGAPLGSNAQREA
jgi:hypothetical protein